MSLPPFAWLVRGSVPGPTVVVMGGTHGDEPVGTIIVDRLRTAFGFAEDETERTVDGVCGILYLMYGNPEALKKNTRAAEGRRDLNRWFQPEEIERAPAASDPADLRRAREIAPILATASVVLDIHSTSSDAPPFLCCIDPVPRHRELVRLFDVPYFMCDPEHLLAHDLGLADPGTTDLWTRRFGGCGLCFETGRQDDASRTQGAWDGTRRFLVDVGSVKHETDVRLFGPQPSTSATQPAFYALAAEITAAEDGFTYVPGKDHGWTPVAEGERIGTYPSGTDVVSPCSGLIVFPRAARLVKKGENLYFVAKPFSF